MAGKGILRIKVLGDDSGLSDTLGHVGGILAKLGIAAMAFEGIKKVGSFLADATKAAQTAQDSFVGLFTVMNNQGQGSAALETSMQAYTDKARVATGVTLDELMPGLTRLQVATKNTTQTQRLMNDALDVAAARHMDLTAVSTALARAQQGTTTSLQRLGIAVKDAAGKALPFKDILANIEKTYKGAAEAIGNVDPWKRLGAVWEVMKEQIGGSLLPYVQAFGDYLLSHMPQIQAAANTAIGAIGVAIDILTGKLALNKDSLTNVRDALTELKVPPDFIAAILTVASVFEHVGAAIGVVAYEFSVLGGDVDVVHRLLNDLSDSMQSKFSPTLRNDIMVPLNIVGDIFVAVGRGVAIFAYLVYSAFEHVGQGIAKFAYTVSCIPGQIQRFFVGLPAIIKAPFELSYIAMKTEIKLIIAMVTSDFGAIPGIIGKALSGCVSAVSGVLDSIGNLIENAAGWLGAKAQKVASAIERPFKWLYDHLVGHSIIPDMVNAIVDWFGVMDDETKKKVTSMVQGISDRMGKMADLVTQGYEQMRTKALAVLDKERAGVETHYSKLLDDARDFVDKQKAIIDRDTSDKTKALQDQIDAIDKAEQDRQDAAERADIMAKKLEANKATDPAEAARLAAEAKDMQARYDEEMRVRGLTAQKDALRDQMDVVRNDADQQKTALDDNLKAQEDKFSAAKDADLAALDIRTAAVNAYFDNMTSAGNVAYKALQALSDQYTGDSTKALDQMFLDWKKNLDDIAKETARVGSVLGSGSSAGVAATGQVPTGSAVSNNQKTITIYVTGNDGAAAGKQIAAALAGA